MVDESVVRQRVQGRKAANELADLYITESARLDREHGLEASIAFLETLRDNLIAIRPLPVVESVAVTTQPVERRRVDSAKTWINNVSDRMVLVQWDEEVKGETEKAILIGEHWVPRSQTVDELEVGDYVEEWPVTRWWAEKANVEYEE